MVIQAKVM